MRVTTLLREQEVTLIKRRRHTPEQIVRKLKEADMLFGEGKDLAEVLKTIDVTASTFHRWRNQYGGMKASEAKRLKELEIENRRLKKIVADQAVDTDMLKEVNRGKF